MPSKIVIEGGDFKEIIMEDSDKMRERERERERVLIY